MNVFEQLISNINSLEIENLLASSAENVEDELIDLNTSQLEDGFLADGNKTEPYANPDYEDMKRSEGSKSVPYADYKLEGDFYKGFNIEFKGFESIWDSSDDKTPKLERRDKPLFGIMPKNIGKAGDLIMTTGGFIEGFTKKLTNGL